MEFGGGGTCDTAGVGSTEATNSGSSCSRVRRRWRLRSACSAGRVSKRCLDTEAVFVCIGGEPRTKWANRDHYQLDPSGYLLTGSDLEVDEIGRPFGWTADRMPYSRDQRKPCVRNRRCAGQVHETSVHRRRRRRDGHQVHSGDVRSRADSDMKES